MTVGKQRAARLAVEREVGFIYVAELIDKPVIKIGFSLKVEQRMRTLFRKKTAPGRLVAAIPGRLGDERALHRTLAPFCIPYRAGWGSEFYPRSILDHPAIPAELRVSA